MINKQKLYSITIVSAAIILMLINIAGATVTPAISWKPADVTYGKGLNETQLNAAAHDPNWKSS
jgi:hypothetical protein